MLLVLVLLTVVARYSCETIHIVPANSNETCVAMAKPCLTLKKLALERASLGSTNLTLYFHPGEHFIDQKLLNFSIESIKMIGLSKNTIVWIQGPEMSILEIDALAIENLILASSNEETVTVSIEECGSIQIVGCTFNRVELDLYVKSIITNQLAKFPKGLFINSCEFNHSTVFATVLEGNTEFQAFINNTIFIFGGGIEMYGQQNSIVYIFSCIFKYNYEGAISTFNVSKVIVANSTFTENKYSNDSIIYLQSYRLEINNCIVTGNLNCKEVVRAETNYLNMTNSEFINNNCLSTVWIDDGYTEEDTGMIHIKNSSFIDNQGRGITNFKYNKLLVTNCVFLSNHVNDFGGAIYSETETFISDTTFTNNSAPVGGAVYLDHYFEIINCIFNSNYLISSADEGNGAAVHIMEDIDKIFKTSLIKDTMFTKNTGSENKDISGVNSTSTEKSAFIITIGIYRLEIDNCTFTDHLNCKGVINADAKYLNITNSEFINNDCLNTVWVDEHNTEEDTGLIHIKNSTFMNNHGGGITNFEYNTLLVSNCVFLGNHADDAGGAIYSEAETFISDTTFTNNSAPVGGAVYLDDHFEIINCIFTRNYLTSSADEKDGAAIHIMEDIDKIFKTSLIKDTMFTKNTGSENKDISGVNSTSTEKSAFIITIGIYHLEIYNCTFTDHLNCKGVINADAKYLNITNSEFINNDCLNTVWVDEHNTEEDTGLIHIKNSTFMNNHGGGITNFEYNTLLVSNCVFLGNHADDAGGAIYSEAETFISDTTFTNNSAPVGGAVYLLDYFEIVNCIFTNNRIRVSEDKMTGSALHIIGLLKEEASKSPVIKNTIFTKNVGSDILGSTLRFENITLSNNGKLSPGKNSFSHNRGCIYLFNSDLYIDGPVTLSNNIGGAIHAVLSNIYIHSNTTVSNNTAISGGGIILRESKLTIESSAILKLSDNKAKMFGGGIYAYQSVIEFVSEGKGFILNNHASKNGGGMFVVASNIKLARSRVTIGSNSAQLRGGGLYLQDNSKIYLLKTQADQKKQDVLDVSLTVTSNSAKYGGGFYIADNSTAGELQCQGLENQTYDENDLATPASECFIQTIKLYQKNIIGILTNTFIINNTAKLGSAIYGGLLDRCTVSPLAEAYYYNSITNGFEYIRMTVNVSNDSTITSDPVKVVICRDHTIRTMKGRMFKLNVSAIDQVGNPVNATIHSSVFTDSRVGRLKEGQTEQTVGNQCTELEYNVFSQDSSAQLEIYADGPCKDMGISKKTVDVVFLPCTCPIGLQPSPSQIECECVCDQELQLYQITDCFQESETIQLETNIWIGVANSTDRIGYVIHNCPFDYCVKKPVNISLNSSQERDRQCAFNRSGVLCGECQQGLSLVLATSKCRACSNTYLLLLIPFALAGIVLIAFILFFNFTIATGTIHGLILFSNLLPTNCFTQLSVLTMFISWVSLDLGIETCFYNGMSSQAKVLFQLVFPVYLFLLMFLIIILSRYSNLFAKLLSNRNPVAALCTLTFLSYSKFLRFIIAALQFTVLEFPDGSKQRIWLYDANVQYFISSRFVLAAIIITVGGSFTLLLFFSQWLPRCSNWKLMKWTRNTKYTALMDAYQAPFISKHRYWAGLLRLALIVHNVIAATAANKYLPILSMGCIAAGILMFKLQSSGPYVSWINNLLENAFLLNLIFLASGIQYANTLEKKHLITVLANVSMATTACLFLLIICYHSYKYIFLPSRFYQKYQEKIKEITKTITKKFRPGPKRQEAEELITNEGRTLETDYTAMGPYSERESDLDELAPITEDDYQPALPPCREYSEVTHTVVETA